jgi:hypothetical protein
MQEGTRRKETQAAVNDHSHTLHVPSIYTLKYV